MDLPIIQNPHLNGNTFHLPADHKTGVLLFHGFTATTVEVRPLAEHLNQAGYGVLAPLLPGHGTTPEDALTVHRDDWIATAENSYASLKSHHSDIVVGGASMGGLLALHLAQKYQDISGIALFAPAVHIQGQWKAQFIAPFKKIIPKYYLAGPSAELPAELDVLPWQGYNVLPVPAVVQFYLLQKMVRRKLGNIHHPVLIFQGRKDKTIDPDGASLLLEKVSSVDKELVWLENSGHTLLLGAEHPQVFLKTLEFIQRVTK